MLDAGEVGEARPAGLKRGRWAWLWWIGVAALGSLAGLAAAIGALLHQAEPSLRLRVARSLEERLQARVELDGFRVSVVDGFQVEGGGLRIWRRVEKAAEGTGAPDGSLHPNDLHPNGQNQKDQPWIVVDRFRFHTGWEVLLSGFFPQRPVQVALVRLDGLRISIPPKGQRTGMKPPPATSTDTHSEASIVVQQLQCRNAELVIGTDKPGKTPLDFRIASLVLSNIGKDAAMRFDAELTNPKPVGAIHSTGSFGPWVAGDPGETPVTGDYRFDHADLSTIRGIGGMLSSTGHYAGTLRNIAVDGETDTPDFRLERVGRGLPLHTRFHAVVDGTDGDTMLDPVDAYLAHSRIVARGEVVRAPAGHSGHRIDLKIVVDPGRIEDLLRLASTAEAPLLTGNLRLDAAFHLPPKEPRDEGTDTNHAAGNPASQAEDNGGKKILDRVTLQGSFHLTGARFSSAKIQDRVEQLSLRGQGRPQDLHWADPRSVRSEMTGTFELADAVLRLAGLDYQVPGARIAAHGSYGLRSGAMDFDGTAHMDASASRMVGGWKGKLLKPMDKLLQGGSGSGTQVGLHVGGTRQSPEVSIDIDRLRITRKSKP